MLVQSPNPFALRLRRPSSFHLAKASSHVALNEEVVSLICLVRWQCRRKFNYVINKILIAMGGNTTDGMAMQDRKTWPPCYWPIGKDGSQNNSDNSSFFRLALARMSQVTSGLDAGTFPKEAEKPLSGVEIGLPSSAGNTSRVARSLR